VTPSPPPGYPEPPGPDPRTGQEPARGRQDPRDLHNRPAEDDAYNRNGRADEYRRSDQTSRADPYSRNGSDDRNPNDDRDEDDQPEPKRQHGPRRRQVAVWLTFASLLLAGWAATSFIDSGNFAVVALAAIAPLVSVLALPVIAVGVASKHLVPTAIAVVAALLPWTLVPGYAAAGPGSIEVGSKSTLRVMSVDGAAGQASAKDIVQVTRLYAVDVVVVTDLTNELAHDLTVEGLSALAPSRWVDVKAGSVHGTGLWARPDIEITTPITGLSRAGIDGLIDAGQTKVGISVVHLAGTPLRPGSAWHSDLNELADRTPPAKDSFIVGDLNAGPWQPAFRRLTGSKWRDAADVVGQGLRPTWPSWSPLPIAPVDHVLTSPGLGVAGADTTNIAGSTHRALIVTLILPRAGG
jgi:endonuclease/exonuclease/phosphatase (EEP) superfamily protein YafD